MGEGGKRCKKNPGAPNGATKDLKPFILDPCRREAAIFWGEGFFFDSFFDSCFYTFFDSFYYRIQNPKKKRSGPNQGLSRS